MNLLIINRLDLYSYSVRAAMVGRHWGFDFGKQNRQGDRVYSDNGIACALTAQPLGNAGGYSYLYKREQEYRIRKLTERECFRLMGVKSEDFENIKENQSTSSLYHLAGDALVTSVLMSIFGELLGIDYKKKVEQLINELQEN